MGYFASVSDFLAMGTHGQYVWSVYGLALLALIWQGLSVRQLGRRVRARARRWHTNNRRTGR